MKKLILFLSLSLCFLMDGNAQTETDSIVAKPTLAITTYYLIRHAEKDRSNPNNSDPELTKKGFFRAENWAEVLSEVPLDAVYSTEYTRTLMTASATAKSKDLEITTYNANDLYNPFFQEATHGKTVLVVGHSNTTPQLVNKIIGEERYASMDDNNNSSLFIVTKAGDQTSVQVLKIN